MENVPTKSLKSNKRKNRKKDRASAIQTGLGATRERGQHNGGIVREFAPDEQKTGRRVERHRAAWECKLDAYLAAKKIDDAQFHAGMRYREAWLFMAQGVQTRDAASIERIDNGGGSPGELVIDKRRGSEKILYEADKEAGLSIGQTLVVRRVCGEDESIGGSGDMKTLCRGLEKLAVYWAFKTPVKVP
jgi:hypothetical protein